MSYICFYEPLVVSSLSGLEAPQSAALDLTLTFFCLAMPLTAAAIIMFVVAFSDGRPSGRDSLACVLMGVLALVLGWSGFTAKLWNAHQLVQKWKQLELPEIQKKCLDIEASLVPAETVKQLAELYGHVETVGLARLYFVPEDVYEAAKIGHYAVCIQACGVSDKSCLIKCRDVVERYVEVYGKMPSLEEVKTRLRLVLDS